VPMNARTATIAASMTWVRTTTREIGDNGCTGGSDAI
jgi:hypothetical protein